MKDYKQLELEFTWNRFCDLKDKRNGAVIGGAILECETDYEYWYICSDILEEFVNDPFIPVLKELHYS